MYHIIRAVRVWPVDHDYLYVYVLLMAGLLLLLALLCFIWLLKAWRRIDELEKLTSRERNWNASLPDLHQR